MNNTKIKKMIKIEDLKKELYIGEYGDQLVDYMDGYICDIITEIADNNIDIYNADLCEWAKYNSDYIDEAIQEFGRPDDFIKEIQQGQYLKHEEDLYENLEDIVKFYMYDFIEKVLDIEEITEEQNDNLLDWDFTDNNEQLENLREHINRIFNYDEED